MQDEIHLLSVFRIRTAKHLACLFHRVSSLLKKSTDGTARDGFVVLMAIRRRERRTTPVASIDPIRTGAGVKDLQNPASLQIQRGLALWRVYIGLSRGIQTRETIAVECLYPLPDIGKGPLDF